MRITKAGKLLPLPVYIYIGKCPRCGCEVECDKEEVMKISDPRQIDIRNRTAVGKVLCPTLECGSDISINATIKEVW